MKNIKISHKILTFMFILTLLAGGLAVKLVTSMSVVNDQSTVIAENWLPSLKATSDMNTATSDFRLGECKHVGTTDAATIEQAEKDIAAVEAKIADLRKQYEPMISSPEEKALYEAFSTEWGRYMKDHKHFLELSRANQNEEASKILYGENLIRFNAAGSAASQLSGAAEELSRQAEILKKEFDTYIEAIRNA